MFKLRQKRLRSARSATAKVPRIGFRGNSTAALESNLVGPFREGLRDLGYEEGRSILIEYRWAEGMYERLPFLIVELIALNVDVIVTAGTSAALAVKKATTSIPLVMIAVGEPVETGASAQGVYLEGPGFGIGIGKPTYRERYYRGYEDYAGPRLYSERRYRGPRVYERDSYRLRDRDWD